jgi:hypothetical protein
MIRVCEVLQRRGIHCAVVRKAECTFGVDLAGLLIMHNLEKM